MSELHVNWLELAILTPLVGVFMILRVRDPEALKRSLLISGLALGLSLAAWIDFTDASFV